MGSDSEKTAKSKVRCGKGKILSRVRKMLDHLKTGHQVSAFRKCFGIAGKVRIPAARIKSLFTEELDQ